MNAFMDHGRAVVQTWARMIHSDCQTQTLFARKVHRWMFKDP